MAQCLKNNTVLYTYKSVKRVDLILSVLITIGKKKKAVAIPRTGPELGALGSV